MAAFRGASLIDAVIARAAAQVTRLAIDVPRAAEAEYRARFGEAVVPDLYGERLGPLCGVVTGLEWLDGDWLASFPCDTPFLPLDLVAQLARRADRHPVVAVHGGRVHPVCALWPKTALSKLRDEIERFRNMRATLHALGAVECAVAAPKHAFFNVNSPEDLREAERLSSPADAAPRDPA